MKTVILSILLLSSNASIKAIDITGRVTDYASQPIEFANVSAFANDSIVGGCVTDSIGCFTLTTSDDCDKIRVSYVGYMDTIISPQGGHLYDKIGRAHV